MGHYSVTNVCPKCGRSYKGRPTLSRNDGTNLICPDCGVREALESVGVQTVEQEEILSIIHENVRF